MNSQVVLEKLQKICYGCDKHLERMNSAAKKMENIMPLDEQKYIALSEDEIEHIDQFLFRFVKLQDSMGQKLFKTMLIFLREEVDGKPFIDILNQMEKIHLIDSASEWIKLRDDRNELSHNYENEPEQMSVVLNKLFREKMARTMKIDLKRNKDGYQLELKLIKMSL
jgi:hypothetical protein